jgi:hypothetical protein
VKLVFGAPDLALIGLTYGVGALIVDFNPAYFFKLLAPIALNLLAGAFKSLVIGVLRVDILPTLF